MYLTYNTVTDGSSIKYHHQNPNHFGSRPTTVFIYYILTVFVILYAN